VRKEVEIDYSDIPLTRSGDWKGAVRGKFYKPIKQQLIVRVDADVGAWLKSQGSGYHGRWNEILRSAMLRSLKQRS